ncbi:hypothetical protein LPJGGPFB_01000 [Ensifer adhaerens]|uniref:flagellar protein n=1 Tax=Ensifer adhaerens TaxID=106592 RepID=UPI001568681C|nr:flagellar protein [Ensifer adhaerens]NRP17774.1 hypothetical protein [Ensifer adhaerens]
MGVTDYDADETIHQRKREGGMPMIDKALAATGIMLAALATFFPWYAFFNQDKFTMPPLWQGSTRDLPEKPARNVLSVSPLAMSDMDGETVAAIDHLTTATVPSLGGGPAAEGKAPQEGLEQPFPGKTGFKLMHVANGRALIEDTTGMYIVRIGSILPDNSRLATLEERDGRWVMITSSGDIYRAD